MKALSVSLQVFFPTILQTAAAAAAARVQRTFTKLTSEFALLHKKNPDLKIEREACLKKNPRNISIFQMFT